MDCFNSICNSLTKSKPIEHFWSFYIHVEILLGSSGLQIVDLFFLIIEPGLPLGFFFLFTFQIQLLVVLGHIWEYVVLCFLEIIFQHASHSIEFVSLSGVHLIFESLLLLSLSFLFDLLIEPFFLLILKELFAGFILWMSQELLKSSPSNSLHPELSVLPSWDGKSRK